MDENTSLWTNATNQASLLSGLLDSNTSLWLNATFQLNLILGLLTSNTSLWSNASAQEEEIQALITSNATAVRNGTDVSFNNGTFQDLYCANYIKETPRIIMFKVQDPYGSTQCSNCNNYFTWMNEYMFDFEINITRILVNVADYDYDINSTLGIADTVDGLTGFVHLIQLNTTNGVFDSGAINLNISANHAGYIYYTDVPDSSIAFIDYTIFYKVT